MLRASAPGRINGPEPLSLKAEISLLKARSLPGLVRSPASAMAPELAVAAVSALAAVIVKVSLFTEMQSLTHGARMKAPELAALPEAAT